MSNTSQYGVINHILSGNQTPPVVGKGATMLSHSDRHAYEVLEVGDGTVTIDRCIVKGKNNSFTEDQEYDYSELAGNPEVLIFKDNAWKSYRVEVVFVPSYYKEYENLGATIGFQEAKKQMIDPLFEDGIIQFIKGKTKFRKSYNPVSIIFGVKEEYYDPSF